MEDGEAFEARCERLRTGALAGEDIAALLPTPNPGWRTVVERRRQDTITAEAARIGQPEADLSDALDSWVRSRVEHEEVRIRLHSSRFAQLAVDPDGRYSTLFTTGASGGAANTGLRILLENTVLGVPVDAPDACRPIYGYLSGSDETFYAPVQQYGEVVIRLKERVRLRSTFTLGDSLDLAVSMGFQRPEFVPVPLTAPRALAGPHFIPLVPATLADACGPHRYAEVQIHGGITFEDVEEVVYSLGSAPDAATVANLGRSGVSWSQTLDPAP